MGSFVAETTNRSAKVEYIPEDTINYSRKSGKRLDAVRKADAVYDGFVMRMESLKLEFLHHKGRFSVFEDFSFEI